jgi:hypothetical protein
MLVDELIKYRYFIGIIVFAVLVLLKVNGSSVDFWKYIVPTGAKSSVVLGSDRQVRSDEWEVQTPYILAQANGKDFYPVNNTTITPSGENMIISYDVPVWDISVLSKPFNWGFLLFGPDYGISWYWNMKIILLLLLSFEMCMIITRQNKLVSLLGSFWIAFSPAIQWWFMQHVCDTVIYMEAIVVLFYYYLLHHDILYRKIIFAALLALSCVGYALILYPGIQIPLAYLTLLFIILISVGFSKTVKLNLADVVIGVCVVAGIGLMLLHVVLISKDAIKAVLNTYYPGKRVSNGGQSANYLFNAFLTNPFLPRRNINIVNSNNCEISSFYNFLPAVILAIPLILKKKVQDLRYFIALAVFSLLCILYMYVKIPVEIAKITLLSFVTFRIEIAYGISALFLSVWALSELSRLKGVGRIYSAVSSILIAATYFITIEFTNLKLYVPMKYYLVLIAILLVLNYCLTRGKKWIFSVVMCGLVAVSGLTVNPINVGIGPIENNTVAQEVKGIVNKDAGANWIANGSNVYGAFLYANGAKSLGGVNFYPDMAKWKILDPNGTYSKIYNRYAHISFYLTNGNTRFVLEMADSIGVYLNMADLKKLNVGYILSQQDLSKWSSKNVLLLNMYPNDKSILHIYKVVYLQGSQKLKASS